MAFSSDCRSPFDPLGYASVVRAERAAEARTVFATVFFGSGLGEAGAVGYMACGTSSGAISVFNLEHVLRRSRVRERKTTTAAAAAAVDRSCGRRKGEDEDGPAVESADVVDASADAAWLASHASDGEAAPTLVVPAHAGAVYALTAFSTDPTDGSQTAGGSPRLLCSAGEDGRTLVWRVADLIAATDAASASASAATVTPAASFVNPQERRPRGALGPVPETTALAADGRRGLVFAAAGDGVCYGWDVVEGREAPAMRLRGHGDMLHCVAARAGAGQAVTGSEDGTARIWDVRSETCTQVVDVWRARSAVGGDNFKGGRWVGCVALDEAENWVAMGCGGRCITMWSYAAAACASRIATAAAPQALMLTGEHIMAAGAEPAVYRWNLAGQLISRQPCTPASVYALDTQPRRLTAAGGTGAGVDLFSELGTRVCTVKCA